MGLEHTNINSYLCSRSTVSSGSRPLHVLEDRPRTVFFAIFHQFVMKLLSFSKLVIVVYRITTSKGALHGQGPKNLQE